MKIALALIAIVIILIVKKLVQRKVKRFELREKRDKRKEKIQNIFSKYKPLHIKKSEVSNIPDSDVLLLATVQLQNRKKIEFTCDEYNFCLLNSAKNIESYPLDKLEAYLISHFDIQPVSEFKNYRHGGRFFYWKKLLLTYKNNQLYSASQNKNRNIIWGY